MAAALTAGRNSLDGGADLALRVTVPAASAEVAGAFLMDLLGPYEEKVPLEGEPSGTVTLVFYPSSEAGFTPEKIISGLAPEVCEACSHVLTVETASVPRDWVDGWRAHFHPVVIGAVRIRPPWESKQAEDHSEGVVDVVINPGLGFGTGLHPTTRGVLELLQVEEALEETGEAIGREVGRGAGTGEDLCRQPIHPLNGPLVDAGTGSGVLAIAAAKLGYGPIVAFDNDAAALASARENIVVNTVEFTVQVFEMGVAEAPGAWFEGATVLANMTLEPVSGLLRRLAVQGSRPTRVVVSGILAGRQEQEVLSAAREAGFLCRREVCEEEWVSLEFLPIHIDEGGAGARVSEIAARSSGGATSGRPAAEARG
jgi:ribosomal protein L11 methyltransferase